LKAGRDRANIYFWQPNSLLAVGTRDLVATYPVPDFWHRKASLAESAVSPLINLGTQHDRGSAQAWMKKSLTTFCRCDGRAKGIAREHHNGFYET